MRFCTALRVCVCVWGDEIENNSNFSCHLKRHFPDKIDNTNVIKLVAKSVSVLMEFQRYCKTN